MSKNPLDQKASREEKQIAHHHFDKIHLTAFLPEKQRKELRSLSYQLWHAVLGDPKGVIDAFDGDFHFKDITKKFVKLSKPFTDFLLKRHKDNTSRVMKEMVHWRSKVKKSYKNKEPNKQSEAILSYLESDELVLSLRQHFGLDGKDKKLKTEFSEVIDKKDDLEKTEDQRKSKKKPKKKISAEEIFSDAFMAEINGQISQSIDLYVKAAKAGHGEAQNILGYYYLTGEAENKGIKKNLQLAVEYLQKSAKQGNPEAMFNLAFGYLQKIDGLDHEPKEITKLFKAAADLNYGEAQNIMGYCYEKGYGITKNEKLSLQNYKKAADQDVVLAQRKMGNIYILINPKEAINYFTKAALQNDPESCSTLGNYYLRGGKPAAGEGQNAFIF